MSHPTRTAPAGPPAARIPADVELPDKVLGPLTARQLAVLAVTTAVLYVLWQATRTAVPTPAFLAAAVPVLAAATAVAVVRRDGVALDRLLLAAIRHHAGGRWRLTAPARIEPAPAWLTAVAVADPEVGLPRRVRGWEAPARTVTPSGTLGGQEIGVVDLAEQGLAVIATASTVNFALRTPGEQEALVGGFGRYLHSLTAPVQVLIRAERIDLSDRIVDLVTRAEHLPDPGLAELSRDHAGFLADLAAQTELLRRQVLLVWRDTLPGHPRRRRGPDVSARRAAEDRLARRVAEAAELLAPTGITVTPLDAAAAGAVLVAAANPALPLPASPEAAAPGETIAAPALATTAAPMADGGIRARPRRIDEPRTGADRIGCGYRDADGEDDEEVGDHIRAVGRSGRRSR